MLECLGDYLLFRGVAGFFLIEVLFASWLICWWKSADRLSANVLRLNTYGLLDPSKLFEAKSSSCDAPKNCSPEFYPGGLTESGYAALLGTLKKVEQKNTALTAVIIFALAMLIGIVSGTDSGDLRQVVSAFSLLLVLPLGASIIGMRQLDVWNTGLLGRANLAEALTDGEVGEKDKLAKRLASDLLRDLTRKETAFRFSWWILLIGLPFFLTTLSLDVLTDLKWCSDPSREYWVRFSGS